MNRVTIVKNITRIYNYLNTVSLAIYLFEPALPFETPSSPWQVVALRTNQWSKMCIGGWGNHCRPRPGSFWNPSLSRPLVVIEFLLAAITAIVGVDAIVVELPHCSITPGHPVSP